MNKVIEENCIIDELTFVVKESFDGGYEANAVGYSIYTQCDNYDELPETLFVQPTSLRNSSYVGSRFCEIRQRRNI